MALPSSYKVGTVSVSVDSAVVTGTNTNWLSSGVRDGDIFAARGLTVSVQSVDSNTQITLAEPWRGPAATGEIYEVRYVSDAVRVLAYSRQAISAMDQIFDQIDEVAETATIAALAKRNAGPTPFDFGAVNDGAADDGAAIQAAMDAVSLQGGGTVYFPSTGRAWITGQKLLHDAKVSLRGHAGRAEIKAKDGMADTLLETRNFTSLATAGNDAAAGSQTFIFENLLFNANAAGNGADTSARGDGVNLYGRDFTLRNVYIKDAPRHGLRASYMNVSGSGFSPYNANLEGVFIDVCGGHGIDWQISDSNWTNINIASPGQLADNTYDAVTATKLIRWTNGAIWRKGFHTNKHRYGIKNASGGASFIGVNIETAQTAGVLNTGSHCRFDVYTYNITGNRHFINTGNYNSLHITAEKQALGVDGYVLRNSGSKNIIAIQATSELGLLDITGGNHNRYEAQGFTGPTVPVIGNYGSYDTAHIIADKGASTEVITRLGPIMRSGTTGNRPSYGAGNTGTYYDTSLGKPIMWTGSAWIDFNGNSV
jgi:hypothetical protein